MLLLLVYYIFAIMGTTLFGPWFPEWFGSIGKSFYTLFQVMTLESRPFLRGLSIQYLYCSVWVIGTHFFEK